MPAETPRYPDQRNLLLLHDGKAFVPVRDAAAWRKRREHILANLQRVMGPLPPPARRPAKPDWTVRDAAEQPGHVRQRIDIATGDGDRVPAFLLLPRRRQGKAAGMLCLHQTTRIGKGEPAGLGGLPNLRYAAELADRGYVAPAPDYPNFGDYRCDPYAMGYASATMKGVWNHARCVDVLAALPEVDGERLGAIGHSLGGHNALFAAAFDERLKAVVTSCGFNAFPKYYGGKLAGWSSRNYMPRIATEFGNDPNRMPFDFPEVLAALTRAVFVNAPLRDDNFEVSGVRDCVAAAKPVYRLLGAAGKLVVEHPDAAHDFPPAVRERVCRFLHAERFAGPSK